MPTQVPEGFSRSEGKTLVRQQNAELARGLVNATRVQAAAMVAGVGLQATAMLSREAAFQADGDPATSSRLNHIVDSYARFVGNEVARFGM
ncbi:hypothetical protein [Mycobacteroides abscessus]|uniref:hypothetical protein n=1 Tax=Mycobacteroides abscessus TaxID=36809 RepID=UPI00266B9CF9|nr:hypothetical protein [Mycobacteroides abscessus]MDO3175898.1 hypothetical protein [Mycobacteroides abscessus subsp. abscessus]